MRAALLLALLAAGPAQALCQGDEYFSCRIGAKELQVCYWKGMLIYQYGPETAPELSLNVTVEEADFTPWAGIGRTMWDSLAFHNDGVTYEVWAAMDKKLEDSEPEPVLQGGVTVMKGGETLASLTCDAGSARSALDTLWDRKTEIGQCWDYEANQWGACK